MIVVRRMRMRRGGRVMVVMMMVVLVVLENEGDAAVGGVDRDVMVAVRHEVKHCQPRGSASHEGDEQQDG